jgi:hypothetical protein
MKGTAFRLPCTNAKDILFVATISLFAVFTILLAMFGRMVKKSFSNKTKVHGKKNVATNGCKKHTVCLLVSVPNNPLSHILSSGPSIGAGELCDGKGPQISRGLKTKAHQYSIFNTLC